MMTHNNTIRNFVHPAATLTRRGARRSSRRGSVLILVVGVLVLIAISAAVYIGVGMQDQMAATAQRSRTIQDAVAGKVFDYLGQILAQDIFGNSDSTTYPFEDNISPLGYSTAYVGERWDYPYTRPGDSTVFNVLADPWLASLEPVHALANPTGWNIWPHISNINPQGKFVDLGKLFINLGGGSTGFYNSIYISGANATPYDLDTYTNFGQTSPFVYTQLMSRQVNGDADPSQVTWADRRLGTDTDGDGRPDARWTELPQITGFPLGMRIFVAVRIVDASAMLNVNANLELGAKTDDDTSDTVGLGRDPEDIDLYTFLFRGFNELNGNSTTPDENFFVNGINTMGHTGFRESLLRTGVQAKYLGTNYAPSNRFKRTKRHEMWQEFAQSPLSPDAGLRPFGPSDESELRTFLFTSNDTATSRLEEAFSGLNRMLPAPSYVSPFRDLSPNELDYYDNSPPVLPDSQHPIGLTRDVRHLLTTYNGSMSLRPWNTGFTNSAAPQTAYDLNALISQTPPDLQKIMGGLMWSLAPFAVDHGDGDGTIYGTPIVWKPTIAGDVYSYGGFDAGYAMFKAGQIAVNAADYYDADDDPTIRTVYFYPENSVPTYPNIGATELDGNFDFGSIAKTGLTGSTTSADESKLKVQVIGLERQPFFREVSTVNVYDDDDGTHMAGDGIIGNNLPVEWVMKLVAVEIGNPWPVPIGLGNYTIKLPDANGANAWTLPTQTLEPGKNIVFYISDKPDSNQGVSDWKAVITGRGNGEAVMSLDGGAGTAINLSPSDDEVQLWANNAKYGGNAVSVLVDRIKPGTSDAAKFPNLLTNPITYGPPNDGGYAMFTASIRRYCDNPQGGFPGYLFEMPDEIATSGRDSNSASPATLLHGNDFTGMVPAWLIIGTNLAYDKLNESDQTKGYGTPPVFAPFQLHVANIAAGNSLNEKDFRSSVDLLLVSTVGNVNFDQPLDGAIPDFATAAKYVTISEQLGDENLATHLGTAFSSVGKPVLKDVLRPAPYAPNYYTPDFRIGSPTDGSGNPFVSKLDYTRYIPQAGGAALPYEALPLATRVVDAFDTLPVDPSNPLVQGRININTAPLKVLERLPFLRPRYKAGPIPAYGIASPVLTSKMVEALMGYRDRDNGANGDLTNGTTTIDWSTDTRYNVSDLKIGANSGLRDDAESRGAARAPGFTSLGELLLATKWQPVAGGTSYVPDPTVASTESMLMPAKDSANLTYTPLSPDVDANGATGYTFDPSDDVSEQLSIIRAIRDCVSTRSDVYVAYVTLAGFSPNDIAQAEQNAKSSSIDAKLVALKASMFQRYVVVFDRSNVKSPTDKPNVLFAIRAVPSR